MPAGKQILIRQSFFFKNDFSTLCHLFFQAAFFVCFILLFPRLFVALMLIK